MVGHFQIIGGLGQVPFCALFFLAGDASGSGLLVGGCMANPSSQSWGQGRPTYRAPLCIIGDAAKAVADGFLRKILLRGWRMARRRLSGSHIPRLLL